jgi:hypothetical protein
MEKQNKHLEWVQRITHLMDSRFTLPGTNFRFGLDPIIGLVPFLGDGVSLMISGLLVSSLWRYNASGEVKARLLVNVLLDFAIGSIPIIGSIFDFFFKANERNLKLIKAHYEEGAYQGDGKRVVWTTALIVIVVIGAVLYLILQVFIWLYQLIFA